MIDRKNRRMSVVDESGKALATCPVGVGRGPLGKKVDMQDCITPEGKFVIDVVLTMDPKLNGIDEHQKISISKNPRFAPLVKDAKGLAGIFATMNRQDFNRDGKPDHAYGYAFLGLSGKATGPKLIAAGNSARWYSIALHGTPNERGAIGAATSEGCIHVPKHVLKSLLDGHKIGVGTPVYIKDGPKNIFDVKRKSSVADNKELVRVRN
ncbi:MAG: L,D-transpeptidase [Candidatus Melainabacteria bacterium]|nr:L,D-transpeptidase [Candidatus Melainabacteria bacterium]